MSLFSRLGELFTDETTGKLSHAKLWSNIGLSGSVTAFVKLAWLGQASDTLWLVFLGTVCSHSVATKIVNAKFGVPTDGESK